MTARSPQEIPGLIAAALNGTCPEALMDLYEPDAVLAVPPQGERVSGRAAIREAMEPVFARVSSARIDVVGLYETDDLAMTHADWTLTEMGEDTEAMEISGRGTVVSRRQADGTWLVVFDNPVGS